MSPDLGQLARPLVGAWTTEATHPALPGATVSGVTFEDDDDTMAGLAKLSVDEKTWQDDLEITYRRSR